MFNLEFYETEDGRKPVEEFMIGMNSRIEQSQAIQE